MYSTLLIMHIAAAIIGLTLAAPILLAPKRRGVHTLLGKVYGGALLTMCLTALALVAYQPSVLWPLAIIAVFVLCLAIPGLWLALRRPRGWFIWHLNLMSSSVIAFITALAVQMTEMDNPFAWIMPTIVGSPLIAHRTLVALGLVEPFRRTRHQPVSDES